MPRVVPSQVVSFIRAVPIAPGPNGVVRLNAVGRPALSATLALADEIPTELLTMDTSLYNMFVYAKEQIREALDVWSANQTAGHPLQVFQLHISKEPLTRIQEALATCPDDFPAPSTTELGFVPDADLRANLRSDMGAVNRALSNAEWKSATVLAGSVIEALLLWALGQRPAADVARVVLMPPRLSGSPIEEWHLPDYIEAAHRLAMIKDSTAVQCRLAKDFRNLVHPGRVERLGQKCDRATALSAVAALEHVVRDLTP